MRRRGASSVVGGGAFETHLEDIAATGEAGEEGAAVERHALGRAGRVGRRNQEREGRVGEERVELLGGDRGLRDRAVLAAHLHRRRLAGLEDDLGDVASLEVPHELGELGHESAL